MYLSLVRAEVDDVSGHYIRGSRSPPGIANHLLRSAVTNHAGIKVRLIGYWFIRTAIIGSEAYYPACPFVGRFVLIL